MTAISKLNPSPAFDGNHVKLCDVCGRPIASAGPYDNPEVVIPYDLQASFPHELDSTGKPRGYGRHYACNAKKQEKMQADAVAAYQALPEEEKARLFNEGSTTAAAAAATAQSEATGVPASAAPTKVEPYRFKAGELPLAKVEAAGGVSKIFTEPKPAPTSPLVAAEAPVDPAEARRLADQEAALEAELRANFAHEQALLNGDVVDDTSEHDRAAAETGLVIPVGEQV